MRLVSWGLDKAWAVCHSISLKMPGPSPKTRASIGERHLRAELCISPYSAVPHPSCRHCRHCSALFASAAHQHGQSYRSSATTERTITDVTQEARRCYVACSLRSLGRTSVPSTAIRRASAQKCPCQSTTLAFCSMCWVCRLMAKGLNTRRSRPLETLTHRA